MTWASRSMTLTVTRTRVFLKKQIWIWPIVAVILLSTIGYFVQSAIESTIKGNVHDGLLSIVNIETEMLEKWLAVQGATTQSLANDVSVRETIYTLLQKNSTTVASTPEEMAQAQRRLADEIAPVMAAHSFAGFILIDESHAVKASSHAVLEGREAIAEYEAFTERALNGETFVSPPFPSVAMIKDANGQLRTGVPTMYACAPVRDPSFQVIAVLALQIRPEREFTQILQLGQVGDSGESYAFNSQGVMVSNSRSDEALILLGLLPDQPGSRSMLQVMIRDPGGDMTQGFRPKVRRSQLPLTAMAADALAAKDATSAHSNVDGYRDYRGVPVIGAWRWLPQYQMGVATELSRAQAFRPLVILQRTFLLIYSLLVLSAIAIFVFTVIIARLQRRSREAVIEAQQLGQYKLEEKLGEGGMGVVYKGRHSMLRRATAIKLLQAEKVNESSIARFEREVQITCQLNHANTIAIYDYGRTPEGVFYYAMEYLDGIDLQKLINDYGPQGETRVIHILLQVCGSLYEAHSQGLVHRDIKPANVMLNRRGCQPDVVKVLDFGLVKAIEQPEGGLHAIGGSLTGTPLYMSPESIQAPLSVDARSDIYAVGAIGYFLLTGHPVFEAANLAELCHKHIDELPVPPSQRSQIEISSQLEDALMSCLEKTRAKRPQTARELSLLLSACAAAGQWSIADGDRWWGRHERGLKGTDGDPLTKKSSSSFDPTLDQPMDFPPRADVDQA